MRIFNIPAITAFGALLLTSQPSFAELKIAVTIKPLHSLVSKITAGVSSPNLILPDGASPHAYALRPSDMRNISSADLLVRIDPAFETFLNRATASTNGKLTVLNALHAQGLHTLSLRESGLWEGHDHDHDKKHDDDHGEKHGDDDDHDDEHEKAKGHKEHEDAHDKHGDKHDKEEAHHDDEEKHHGHADAKKHSDESAEHQHGDDHDETDLHVWLHPDNARAIIRSVAGKLAEMDPANAMTYMANAKSAVSDIENLHEELNKTLQESKNKRFFVFHDAYQYFEDAFQLTAVGSISLNADRQPGARRIRELRHRIEKENDIACVFAEPQFNPRMVKTLVHGTGAKAGILDPIGVGIPAGPDAYNAIMMRLAQQLTDCLDPQ